MKKAHRPSYIAMSHTWMHGRQGVYFALLGGRRQCVNAQDFAKPVCQGKNLDFSGPISCNSKMKQ